MLNKRPIIMDFDTGVDDTLAFLLAAAADSLDLKAITTVFGNCSVIVGHSGGVFQPPRANGRSDKSRN